MKCNNGDFMEGQMKRRIPKRSYTSEYREAAVRQVVEAQRTLSEVARSLEISHKTLANWVRRARAHTALVKREPALAPDAAAVELARLRAENARLRMDNEILKNRPRGSPRPICLETSGCVH
jgi:transposase